MGNRVDLENLGCRILCSVRTELYLSMRFMGPALDALGFQMDLSTTTCGTDAAYIRFNPNYLMEMYLAHGQSLDRLYMHILLHCLFRHLFSMRSHEDRELWDLCADIAVESVVDSMDYDIINRTITDYRQQCYDTLENAVQVLTAERLYQYFISGERDYYYEDRLRREFCMDDHVFWRILEDQEKEEKDKNKPDQPDDPNRQNNNRPNDEKQQPKDEKKKGRLKRGGSISMKDDEWKKKAERIKSEIELTSKKESDEKGSLARILAYDLKETTDFREFLRNFAVVREEAVIDPDSFDYGFYNYGMEMYGNMPLIEENEFREVKRVDELVIAIDTSASCQDRLVQEFLNDTAAVLFSEETFFHKVQIHIIACDDQVQQDTLITDTAQMKKYAQGFTLKGGYGTDFRPVFAYVEELRKKGEIQHLRGLMYFTDGFGIYPKKPPQYDTAFVFRRDEEINDSDVPGWALKLYLS